MKRAAFLTELADIVTVLPPCYGREYFKTIASAKVGINIHSHWAFGAGGNMRQWETLGMATALVTDEVNTEIAGALGAYRTFRTIDEARTAINLALEHSEDIGIHGHGLAKRAGNPVDRVKRLIKMVEDLEAAGAE
jgi:hypothetical protein